MKTKKYDKLSVIEKLRKSFASSKMRLEAKEKEVDRMKSEFISTTSHELRTPLAAIKESVMLVLDETAGKTSREQSRFLTIAKKNIDRLTQLINDLLDISKIETGKMEIKKKRRGINRVIGKALDSMAVLADENRLDLRFDFMDGLPDIVCDEDKIVQVMVNLIGNAIKFTPAGGTVSVHTGFSGRKKGFIEVAVKDTGAGIDKKDMSKLFKKFGQLDVSLTRSPGGTGLGLAICKNLVEMHGGEMWAESAAKKGSKFFFTLPIMTNGKKRGPR